MNGRSVFANRKHLRWSYLFVLLILVLAACQPAGTPEVPVTGQSDNAAPTTAPTMAAPTMAAPAAPTSAPAAAVTSEAVVNVATDPKLGEILVDEKGMTLYMFTKDEPDKSNCKGGCLQAWPPLLSLGSPKAGEGVDASLLGTATMDDGSKIVTYNRMPLYYWVNDKKPGDTTGQDVNKVWYVVNPEGEPVGMDSSAPSETAAPTATKAPAAAVPATGASASASEVVINVATDPKLGKILVDGKGMTLYMFTKDEANKSNCKGGCLKAWPPLVDNGSVKAGEGVDASLLGTADLEDGSKIVTYNKMPLYYWAEDTKPGDTTGQDVNKVWYVVAPDGKPVGMGSSSAPAPAAGAAAANEVVINVVTDDTLGKILVDGKGMTLYMFTKDEANKSNCSGGCLKAWPPLVAQGNVKAGEGVDAKLIGTGTLPDGSKIVTYNKMPLYYYQGDTKPGDVTGQDVNKVWYVVSPGGKPVMSGDY